MWVCQNYKETHEDNFDACWNFGYEKDTRTTSNRGQFAKINKGKKTRSFRLIVFYSNALFLFGILLLVVGFFKMIESSSDSNTDILSGTLLSVIGVSFEVTSEL